jgi:hypothetical protein
MTLIRVSKGLHGPKNHLSEGIQILEPLHKNISLILPPRSVDLGYTLNEPTIIAH